MYYFIYETKNLINGKLYRGIHKTENINDGYLGSGLVFCKAVKKYGKDNFERSILEYCNSYDELLERVLKPIYPNNEILKFNAQAKSRAIAGCVQDKRYYQQVGARNSGKGVESDLLKSAFEKFVDEFAIQLSSIQG